MNEGHGSSGASRFNLPQWAAFGAAFGAALGVIVDDVAVTVGACVALGLLDWFMDRLEAFA
jgi:hypothetical protein